MEVFENCEFDFSELIAGEEVGLPCVVLSGEYLRYQSELKELFGTKILTKRSSGTDNRENKAVYTTASVACGWAGYKINLLFHLKTSQKESVTDRL